MSEELHIIITTLPKTHTTNLAESLIKERLAACVQILPEMQSIYLWKNQVEKAEEQLLFIKTLKYKLLDCINFIKKVHPYDVPEIISWPATFVLPSYLGWMEQNLDLKK